MKKIVAVLSSFALFLVILISPISGEKASAAGPKVTIKNYKSKQFQYAVISGSKYTAANKTMLNYTKKVYKENLAVKKQLKQEQKEGWTSYDMEYSTAISCKVAYKTTKKLSIYCVDSGYTGGAHGFAAVKTFNYLNGKAIGLKSAFKSTSHYNKGKKAATSYLLKRPSKFIFADKSTSIAGHPFYWTKNGLSVVMGQYEVAAYSEGMPAIPIAKTLLK